MDTQPRYRGILVRLAQLLVQYAVFGVILFAAAGTLAWPNAWVFLALALLIVLANAGPAVPCARTQL